MLIERGGNNRGTDVTRAATDECRLGDEMQAVGVFKIFQATQRLVFVGAPAVEIGLCSSAFLAAQTLRRMLIHADDKLLIVMVVGTQIVRRIPLASGFRLSDGLLVFLRELFDEPVLLAGPQAAGSMARRKDERLDALRLLVDDVRDGLHGTP